MILWSAVVLMILEFFDSYSHRRRIVYGLHGHVHTQQSQTTSEVSTPLSRLKETGVFSDLTKQSVSHLRKIDP